MKDQAMRKEKSWPYAIFVDCSFRCLLQVLFAAASSKAHIKVEITVMECGSGNEAMDKILWSILNIIALMYRLSMFAADKTVTVVALSEWFVRCGFIPALDVILGSIFSSVLWPSGLEQYHTRSIAGLNA